jgi:hypothetical protein
MGFFSNLKNSLTGGWADVTVSTGPARRGEPLAVTVVISVKSSEIVVNEVYLQLECKEVVELPNYPVPDPDKPGTTRSVTIRETTSLHRLKHVLAPGRTFAAQSQHTFNASIGLPGDLPPSYNGRLARIEWLVLAGLEMKGNDPDSGWQPVRVE